MIFLVLVLGLIVSINSCQKEEAFPVDNETTLNSTIKSSSSLIPEAQTWFENNADQNEYLLTVEKDQLKWNKAIVHDQDSMKIIEVPIKLRANHDVIIKDKDKLNVEQRFLFIKKGGVYYSVMEFIIASDSKENLQNVKKINYGNRKNDFVGTFFYVNTNGKQGSEQFGDNKLNFGDNLKSATIECMFHYYYYANDPYTVYREALYCWRIDGSGGGSPDPGTMNPDACNCDPCPLCGDCLTQSLKVVPVDSDEEPYSNSCPDCNPEICGFEEYKCLYDILKTLSENPTIDMDNYVVNNQLSNQITEFFDLSKETDLVFTVEDLGDPATTATTTRVVGSNFYSIILNTSYVERATSLSIARTMIHEIIHANLLNKYDQRTGEFYDLYNLSLEDARMNDMALNQHTYMTGLVSLIGLNLHDWAIKNNNLVSHEYCNKLAWAGLSETDHYNGLSNLAEIEQIILNEYLNNGNAKGEACQQ